MRRTTAPGYDIGVVLVPRAGRSAGAGGVDVNRPDLLAEIDQRNLDWLLTERIRGLIQDFLRPPGSGLPEPTAGHPPRLAVGPIPASTSGPQTSSRRGAQVNGAELLPFAAPETNASEVRSWPPECAPAATTGTPTKDTGERAGRGADGSDPTPEFRYRAPRLAVQTGTVGVPVHTPSPRDRLSGSAFGLGQPSPRAPSMRSRND